MQIRPFDTCFHPQRIYNKYTGTFEYVACGKCPACLNARGDKQSKMIDAEFKKYRFCLFFTLTYNNASIPTFRRVYDEHGFSRLVPFGRIGEMDNYFSYLPYRPFVTDDGVKRKKLSYGVPNVNELECVEDAVFLPPIQNSSFKKDVFAVCCKQDLIRFFKRFRKRLDEEFKQEEHRISYYACSEYGPRTYRPHYHVLLFFDNPKICEKVQSLIFESWGKFERLSGRGRNRFAFRPFQASDRFKFSSATCRDGNLSWVTNNGMSASRYVSSYVTGNSDLPKVLQLKAFRPFSIHSKGNTFGSTEADRKEVYEHFKKGWQHRYDYFGPYQFCYDRDVTYFPDGKPPYTLSIPFPRFLLASLWCKPFGYRLLSASSKSAVITFICRHYSGTPRSLKGKQSYFKSRFSDEFERLNMSQPQNWTAALRCYRYCFFHGEAPEVFAQVYDFSLRSFELYRLRKFYEQQQSLLQLYPRTLLAGAYVNAFDDLPAFKPHFSSFSHSVGFLLSLGFTIQQLYPDGYNLDMSFVDTLRAENQAFYKQWKNDVLETAFQRNKSKVKENYAQV